MDPLAAATAPWLAVDWFLRRAAAKSTQHIIGWLSVQAQEIRDGYLMKCLGFNTSLQHAWVEGNTAGYIWIFLDLARGKRAKILLKTWQIWGVVAVTDVFGGPKITESHSVIRKSVVYLLQSLCHIMVRPIWLSAPKGLFCVALQSFDILSDTAVPKQLCWMRGSPGVVESKSR